MKTWKYCSYSGTVRQMPENYCLFSAKTFTEGGTYDAAALPEAVENLRLAAAAPELLAALEGLHDAMSRMIDKYDPDSIEAEWLAHSHEAMCNARGDK